MTDQDQDQEQKQDRAEGEQEDVNFYEKMAERTAELLEEGRRTFDEALKKAQDELSRAGEFTSEHADRVAAWVRRDVIEGAGKASEVVKRAVEPHRVAAGAQSALARILTGTADALNDLARKAEQAVEIRTGEVTSAGTLTCKECGGEMHIHQATRIPPCPKCHKTLFRKTY